MEIMQKQSVSIETDETLGSLTVTGVVSQKVDSNSGGVDEPASYTDIGEASVEIEKIYDEFDELISIDDISAEDKAMIEAMLIAAAKEHSDDFEDEEDFEDDNMYNDLEKYDDDFDGADDCDLLDDFDDEE